MCEKCQKDLYEEERAKWPDDALRDWLTTMVCFVRVELGMCFLHNFHFFLSTRKYISLITRRIHERYFLRLLG